MKLPFSSNRRRVSSRPRRMGGRQVTTRSGRVLRVNSSVSGRWAERREAKARRKVERMRGLPKSRVKRILWRMNPRRQAEFWFSRDGAVMALKVIGVAIFVFFVLVIGLFAYFRKDLKALNDLSNKNLSGSLVFYDRSDKIYLGQLYGSRKRVPVPFDQMSHWVKDATVAVEDRDFYKHRGFDVKGIARAGINDIFHHGAKQGGSTITQQLVKLAEGWQQKRSVGTKIKEIILAVELERTSSKDKILQQYLNLAPYGGLDYGVQAAAQDYFHKNASQLTLEESAMLAAIPKSPAYLSPYNKLLFDKQLFLNRYAYVLDSMVKTGKISQARADKAKKFKILSHYNNQPSAYSGIVAPYFILAAKNQVEALYATNGPDQSSTAQQDTQALRITTTLDMKIQKLAEDKVRANTPNIYAHLADTAATVVEDVQTGQYVALVGGLDFNNKQYGQINYAQRNLSPGSSFKPYDYSTLIQNRTDTGAGSVLYDTVGPIPPYYNCTNRALPGSPGADCLWDFDRRSPGPLTLRYALGGSRNIPAVKAMSEAVQGGTVRESIDKTIKTAEKLMNNGAQYACYKQGADINLQNKADQVPCNTSSAIGDGAYLHLDHHVNGLASLGRLGLSIPATYVLKIQDASGKSIPVWKPMKKGDTVPGLGTAEQVVDPQTAYIVNDMLSDPRASYFAYGTKFQNWNGWKIAVKTGTTNDAFDGLMMAYTTKYAVGSWVGYHTRTKALIGPMENITMPMTRDILQGALTMSHSKVENWQRPAGIKNAPGYIIRSHVAYGSQEPSPATEIYPSWYKPPGSSNTNQTIDKVSGKIATKCTPPAAKQFQAGSTTANHFSIDIFYGTRAVQSNNRSGATDDVHSCSDNPPSVDTFFINGQDVSGGGTVDCSSRCKVTTTVSAGTHPFVDSHYSQFPGNVQLIANGAVYQTKSVSSSPTTVNFNYTGGAARLLIRVNDSVLYSADSSSASVKKSSGSPLKFGAATKTGGTTTISWSGGSGTYTVTDVDKNKVICSTHQTTCDSSTPGKNDTIRVSDGTSTASGTVN